MLLSKIKKLFKNSKFTFSLIIILCTLLGFFAGFQGAFIGFIVGFFLALILKRQSEEKRYRLALENLEPSPIEGEPFSGALYMSAVAVYCVGDASITARQINSVFKNQINVDWNIFCNASHLATGVNGDLMTECLASALKKSIASKEANTELIKSIFTLLGIVEFAWDEKNKGEKPSKYLAELLNYEYVANELLSAYSILGLPSSASLKDVKTAHRKLAARFHPDSHSTQDAKAAETQLSNFMRVQAAYETILTQLS